jgi:hypothetical protein
MKIRYGFVSNSSTTSFCIYGVSLERSKLKEVAKKNNVDTKDYDFAETLFNKHKLYCVADPDEDNVYVGKELSTMKDYETFGFFKKSIEQQLKQLGIDDTCSVIQESWYNG